MKATTSELRVKNHNEWPAVELFPCEIELLQRLAQKNMQQIFITARFMPDEKDEPFNAAVGHILDCLDSLPKRPDAAFDSLYKVIDSNLAEFSEPNLSPMHSTVKAFFLAHPSEWSKITEILSANLPQQTADYAASRILDCHVDGGLPHADEIKKRASRSLGKQRYKDFCEKYLVENPQMQGSYSMPYENRRNAGRLMKLLFRLKKSGDCSGDVSKIEASDQMGVQYNSLDLGEDCNRLSSDEKLKVIMEACLYTYRNERFHGDAFSPFRSGKAKLKTYAHAYFMLNAAYVIVLGMLHLQGKGGISISHIVEITIRSMQQFAAFFEDVVNE
ncbi:hypothetical protein [Azospirillum brasilense]|uniref:hypothetical protein n=1 Tax=Azospirillum brasilense TaxID=192 RepID=UPI0011C39706|nr:hypothetical protein [Azospirillum brasilense]NUB27224.1 hypothetical protein [Azospirillum brasilense]NUB36315.1 hypothetical protein [Azospirillum brasilense]